jgi:replication initiation protein RepC
VQPDPTWPNIVDAAYYLRQDFGASKSLWDNGCMTMGRALAGRGARHCVNTNDADYFTSLPAGYFHGLVAKYVAGELHLERSVWALRRADEPVRYPDRKDRSHRRDVQRDW